MTRPTSVIPRLGKAKGATATRQETTCKACGRGIYTDQSRVWQQRPVMGLVHDTCATKEEA